jgi:hypothetical protein
MQNPLRLLLISAPIIGACGASFPPPTQRLADAQAAERSAREVGANSSPEAQLSLKLAQDQIAQAQKAMDNGDNEQANSLLVRAKMDGELALARAREKNARAGHQEATAESADQKAVNVIQGAVK